MKNRINISKKAAAEISSLINTMTCEKLAIERKCREGVADDAVCATQHMIWFNEAADSLIAAGIDVVKYKIEPWAYDAAKRRTARLIKAQKEAA